MTSLKPPRHPLKAVTPTFQVRKLRLNEKQGFAPGPTGRKSHMLFVPLGMHPVPVLAILRPSIWPLREGGGIPSSLGLPFLTLRQFPQSCL